MDTTISWTAIKDALNESRIDREELQTDYNESLYSNRYGSPFKWC